jgi:hypothetical protein
MHFVGLYIEPREVVLLGSGIVHLETVIQLTDMLGKTFLHHALLGMGRYLGGIHEMNTNRQ